MLMMKKTKLRQIRQVRIDQTWSRVGWAELVRATKDELS